MELRPRVELLEAGVASAEGQSLDHHRPLLETNSPFEQNALHRHTADLMLRVAEVRLPNIVSLPFPKILERKAL
jgi:hypothetical protein